MLYVIKRILSLWVILPTQCFVFAVWYLGIGLYKALVSRQALISSSPGNDNEARQVKGGGDGRKGRGVKGGGDGFEE